MYFVFDEPRQYQTKEARTLAEFLSFITNFELNDQQFLFPDTVDVDAAYEVYKKAIAKEEDDLKTDFSKRSANDSSTDYRVFYRGLEDISYDNSPSIYRKHNIDYEDRYIKDIRVFNPDFTKGKTYLDELSSLQHYGCPTRLLDLTSNPLVALYFACVDVEHTNKRCDGVVHLYLALDKDILDANSDRVLILTALSHLSKNEKKHIYDECVRQISIDGVDKSRLKVRKKSVNKLYHEIEKITSFERRIKCLDILKSFYVQPQLSNDRIKAQQGLFLINGLCKDNRECSTRNENKIIMKIVIPYSCKRTILKQLDVIGINSKNLFPEIEDTVRYLKKKYGA